MVEGSGTLYMSMRLLLRSAIQRFPDWSTVMPWGQSNCPGALP